MKRFVPAALVLIALVLTAVARSEDKKDSATGTWVWKDKGRNGQEIKRKLKLKQESDKLTGAIIGRGRTSAETEIEDGKVKDGDFSFKVTYETNNGKIVMTYTAKVNGDEIKGKIETDRNGRTRERDWEAKRVKDDDKKE